MTVTVSDCKPDPQRRGGQDRLAKATNGGMPRSVELTAVIARESRIADLTRRGRFPGFGQRQGRLA